MAHSVNSVLAGFMPSLHVAHRRTFPNVPFMVSLITTFTSIYQPEQRRDPGRTFAHNLPDQLDYPSPYYGYYPMCMISLQSYSG